VLRVFRVCFPCFNRSVLREPIARGVESLVDVQALPGRRAKRRSVKNERLGWYAVP
jgi:hypothetical protein